MGVQPGNHDYAVMVYSRRLDIAVGLPNVMHAMKRCGPRASAPHVDQKSFTEKDNFRVMSDIS